MLQSLEVILKQRNPEFIKIKSSRTDYGLFSSFNSACRAFNFAALYIDPTASTTFADMFIF